MVYYRVGGAHFFAGNIGVHLVFFLDTEALEVNDLHSVRGANRHVHLVAINVHVHRRDTTGSIGVDAQLFDLVGFQIDG